jgi:hypothetical protein
MDNVEEIQKELAKKREEYVRGLEHGYFNQEKHERLIELEIHCDIALSLRRIAEILNTTAVIEGEQDV